MKESIALSARRSGATLVHNELVRLAVLVTIAALQLDWVTKSWALQALHGTMPVGGLLLGVEHNPAFAFSTGAGMVSQELVASVRLGALTLLVVLAVTLGLRARRYAAGVGLILGGGLGNTVDLLLRSHGVVDFIGAGPFSLRLGDRDVVFALVFNAADVAVLVGVVLLAPVIRQWAIAAQQRIGEWGRRWLPDES